MRMEYLLGRACLKPLKRSYALTNVQLSLHSATSRTVWMLFMSQETHNVGSLIDSSASLLPETATWTRLLNGRETAFLECNRLAPANTLLVIDDLSRVYLNVGNPE